MTDDIPSCIKILGAEFSRILRNWLSEDEMTEVIRRNDTPGYVDCCATHDFCDPNQAMIDAYKNVFDREVNINSDPDHYITCNAWAFAKENKFFTNNLTQCNDQKHQPIL